MKTIEELEAEDKNYREVELHVITRQVRRSLQKMGHRGLPWGRGRHFKSRQRRRRLAESRRKMATASRRRNRRT